MAAYILTHNAPRALRRCVNAVAAQIPPPDSILVIDNASEPAVVARELHGDSEVVRSECNTGPAGGHHLGLSHFLSTAATHAWVMDDDCVPAPGALAALLNREDETNAGLVFPTWVDESTERVVNWPAWCGFLIARSTVERAGLPRADFVWWAEDTEYLQWRIPEAGVRVTRADAAVVLHSQVRRYGPRPAWKYYYECRNSVFFRLYVQRRGIRRFYRLAWTLIRLGGSAIRGPQRIRMLLMIVRGVVDGLFGRLGLRIKLEASERPATTLSSRK